MTNQPSLSSLDLWSYYERIYLRLLREAVAEMANQLPSEYENALNRCLHKAIYSATLRAMQSGEDDVPLVVYDVPNRPAASDSEPAERESKRPDFRWTHLDPLADNPDDAYQDFTVECKRLSDESTAYYAREYVKEGIARFIKSSHGYGKGSPSGAMVGYLQYIRIDDAIDRVNKVIVLNSIPVIAMTRRDSEMRAELEHDFKREFPVSPYHLFHIWARVGDVPSGPQPQSHKPLDAKEEG